MSQLQKYARFNLAVFGLAVAVYLVAMPFIGPKAALGAFGLCGLWGLGARYVRRGRDGKPTIDERDQQIWQQSTVAGYSIFWLAFVAACMLPWFIAGPNGSIPVQVLPLYVGAGWATFMVVQSIVILVQYARGAGYASE
jgi:hypothetical protein